MPRGEKDVQIDVREEKSGMRRRPVNSVQNRGGDQSLSTFSGQVGRRKRGGERVKTLQERPFWVFSSGRKGGNNPTASYVCGIEEARGGGGRRGKGGRSN